MEAKIVYFEKAGRENTGEVLRIVKQRASELGIKTVLVASTKGEVAVKAVDALKGLKVIAVSHATGWKEPNAQEFTEENRRRFEAQGGTLLVCGHTFAGIGRAIRDKFSTYGFEDIVASCFRVFGEGTKVCVEIAMMAADAGLVRTDEDVVCVAGSAQGADTAIVLTPVNSRRFFSLKVKEILCKPHF